MPINLNATDALSLLNLKRDDFNGLTDSQARSQINTAYRKAAVKFHPDQNKSEEAPAEFRKITVARDELLGVNTVSKDRDKPDGRHQINQYIVKIEIPLSNTDFNLLMRDRVAQSYQELLHEFTLLNTETERRAFAKENAAFIALAQRLLAKEHDLHHHWEHWLNRSFWDVLIYEWRSAIIEAFGEEFLDDFDYRHALATGALYPILATRKLLSPLKLILVFAQSAIIPVKLLFDYAIQALKRLYIAEEYLEIAAAISVFALGVMYLPAMIQLTVAASFIERLLKILASPVNSLIRPLAQWTSISPEWLTVGTAAVGLAALTALVFSAALLSVTTEILILIWAYRALLAMQFYWSLTTGICLLKMDSLRVSGIFFMSATMVLVSLAHSLCFGAWVSLDWIPDIALLLEETASACRALVVDNFLWAGVAYKVANDIEHAEENGTKMMQLLPLPDVPVAEATKEAARQRINTGDYSNQFFNTPPSAKTLREQERTFGQKTSSFFGGGAKYPEPKATPEFKEPGSQLLLTMA